MNTQTILSAVTCAQLEVIMAQLEELQALCISQYEGIAMQEQELINKLEHHEDVVDAKKYARTVCTAAKKELKRINNNYDNACQDYLFDLADELDQAINEAKQYNLTDVVEYCTKMHCLLISTYEGVVMHQEA